MKLDDLKVVFRSAIAMAQRDGKLDKKEAQLIQELLDLSGIGLADVGGMGGGGSDPEAAVRNLSSTKAKRAYLLTLACVALVDGELADEELDYFSKKAVQLGVGTIDLSQMTLDKGVATIKRIVGELVGSDDLDFSGGQKSDIDLL